MVGDEAPPKNADRLIASTAYKIAQRCFPFRRRYLAVVQLSPSRRRRVSLDSCRPHQAVSLFPQSASRRCQTFGCETATALLKTASPCRTSKRDAGFNIEISTFPIRSFYEQERLSPSRGSQSRLVPPARDAGLRGSQILKESAS